MTCDLCGKHAATVHLTEIAHERSRELHLCEPCAREKGVKGEPALGLADLMTSLADLEGQLDAPGVPPPAPCPQCGMRFEEFKRSGRLGCGACYAAFQQPLELLLRHIHGASRHAGKAPAATSPVAKLQAELDGLKSRLAQAVKAEAFETAAQGRDQIHLGEQSLKLQGVRRATRSRGSR